MAGFVEALLGAQMSGGGIGSGLKATPVGRAAAVKMPLVSGQGSKGGKGIALVYGESQARARVGDLRREHELTPPASTATRSRERYPGTCWASCVQAHRRVRRGVPSGQV